MQNVRLHLPFVSVNKSAAFNGQFKPVPGRQAVGEASALIRVLSVERLVLVVVLDCLPRRAERGRRRPRARSGKIPLLYRPRRRPCVLG
jgi:hypothetical protein